MRVVSSWLREFVDPDLSVDELADVMTGGGLIVEAVEYPTDDVRGVRVARVDEIAPITGSDALSLVTIFDGERDRPIVCGARNMAIGDLVAAALPGATLPGGMRIDTRTIMGHTSQGMLASARELGIGDDHRGIVVLDADAPVGEDLRAWLDLGDPVFDIEVTPDRGYLLSVSGVARDVAALTGAPLRLPQPQPIGGDAGVPVTIDDHDRCRRFVTATLDDVAVGPSPFWLQRRLSAAGMRPVSNIVDVTNAVMLETGNPVHAYDLALLAGPELVVRTARAGERLRTLDGVERTLDPEDLLICDADGPVGLAGVMGGETTEINAETTTVLVEAANFSPRTVLRTARRHELTTQGAMRWERQVPPESAPLAAARCAEMIAALAGGVITGGADRYPSPPQRMPIRLRPARAAAHLGLDLDADDQADLLARIGCEVSVEEDGARDDADARGDSLRTDGTSGGALAITAPAYRPDLTDEVDLYEEIARMYGYDRIPETLPSTGQAGSRTPVDRARTAARQALAGAGWYEPLTDPFITDAELADLGWADDDRRRRTIALVNPLSKEADVLRTSLLPTLLRVVRSNANRRVPSAILFEIGRVFLAPTDEEPGADGGPHGVTLPAEPLMLGLAGYGRMRADRHDEPGRDLDVFDLIGACQLLAWRTGRPGLQSSPTDAAPFHPGRAARLALDGQELGVVGELHPRVIERLGLPPRALAGEIRLAPLLDGGVVQRAVTAPSTLPGLRFDVAVVVAAETPAHDVHLAVREGAGARATDVALFDVYTGSPLQADQRSLAFHVALDDPSEQLTDVDEAAAISAIERSVADAVGGHLRR